MISPTSHRSSLSRRKQHGIHYTPPHLAAFLAQATLEHTHAPSHQLCVLDPACGDGGLLRAFAHAVPDNLRPRLALFGYETDPVALQQARDSLGRLNLPAIHLTPGDFLALYAKQATLHSAPLPQQLPFPSDTQHPQFDVVIANPPYVRTQVLGSHKARELARLFQLSGRVDLYHAFIKAAAAFLRPGGTLGLLTSNRFLSVQSGAATRQFLRAEFDLQALYDLGDTKLFRAAVLPAILIATKTKQDRPHHCAFARIYEHRASLPEPPALADFESPLEALRSRATGPVKVRSKTFIITRGTLAPGADPRAPWILSTAATRSWIRQVEAATTQTFGTVAHVRVGIKTTADKVFIRDDWHSLPMESRPEQPLLHPLMTHQHAARWRVNTSQPLHSKVLYPHEVREGNRRPVDLHAYPRANAYLAAHYDQLAARSYVSKAGRLWYEIWVPQDPAAWAQPKIVFPDIAEYPRFFLDNTGAIVNGDCYWLTLRSAVDPRYLLLILGVANSSFITTYYDLRCHNKLYAGRRRFITQYVTRFPLPDIDSRPAQHIIHLVSKLTQPGTSSTELPGLETYLDDLVWASFGLVKEPVG